MSMSGLRRLSMSTREAVGAHSATRRKPRTESSSGLPGNGGVGVRRCLRRGSGKQQPADDECGVSIKRLAAWDSRSHWHEVANPGRSRALVLNAGATPPGCPRRRRHRRIRRPVERVHGAKMLDCGVSPWDARPKPKPTAAYWSPDSPSTHSKGCPCWRTRTRHRWSGSARPRLSAEMREASA